MNNVDKQILDLITSSGKSAPKMTNALKAIGNGNMANGIKRIAVYMTEDVLKKGRVQGALGVGIITLPLLIAAVTILLKDKINKDKKHMEEGETLLKGLEEEFSDIINDAGDPSECDPAVEEGI